MRKSMGVAASMALAFGGVSTSATPIRYDCDTAAGSFSMIDFVQPGPDYRVTGRISARAFRAHEYYPVANIQLVSARNLVGLRLRREQANGPIEFVLQSRGQAGLREAVLAIVEQGDATPFLVEVVRGVARVEVAGQSRTVDVPISAGATLQISCSTGQFVFEDLDWGPPGPR
jgi:hypothetical protein